MEASTDLFVNLIQENRILYDKSLKDFKNTKKKEDARHRITAISRMTVDSAKKRYFSLRQKYCREKRNIELRRRKKCPPRGTWVYYERLRFLDSFIQPRVTYTNDFVDEDHDELMCENGSAAFVENSIESESSNIEIQLQEGISMDMLSFCEENENNEVAINLDLQMPVETQYSQETSNNDHSNNCDESVVTDYVGSKYAGEVSSCDNIPTTGLDQIDETANGARDGEAAATPRDDHDFSEDLFDLTNYMSPIPGPSRFAVQMAAAAMRKESSINKNMSVGYKSVSKAVNRPVITEQMQQQCTSTIDSSAPIRTAPKKTTYRHGQSNVVNAPMTSSDQKTVAPVRDNVTTESSKEKRIEAIRQKMESCLTAITTKVTEKAHRSPHAPFLAYLGTKLPNVPKEILPSWGTGIKNSFTYKKALIRARQI